jgi:uncharacterized membrane protein
MLFILDLILFYATNYTFMTKGLLFVNFHLVHWMPSAQLSQKLLQVTPEPQVKSLVFFALFPVLIAFSFLIFVFYRSRREAVFREKETELQLQKTEVALKALKAQINPHFIFNCLNSIHHYMYHHPVQEAGNFLLKFSQQIRYVLESSEVKMVPLADEIEANKNYLELEQLRVNHAFRFNFASRPYPRPRIHPYSPDADTAFFGKCRVARCRGRRRDRDQNFPMGRLAPALPNTGFR